MASAKISFGKNSFSSPPPLPPNDPPRVEALVSSGALHFDSPVSELAYVLEKLRLADESLEAERELRKLAERKLQQLVQEAPKAEPSVHESVSPMKGATTPSRRVLESPGGGTPHRHERIMERAVPSSPRGAGLEDAEESKAREERWSTIARINKRKVVDLEAQARGDERRILRLERQLEAERAERAQTDQSFATILAHMEDSLEALHRAEIVQDEELKKTYSVARGISRSPNKSVRDKASALTQAVHALYSSQSRLTDAKVMELEASLVEVHRHSQQLEVRAAAGCGGAGCEVLLQAALAAKLDDLDKARVLFRQICTLLPSGDRPVEAIQNVLLSPSSAALVGTQVGSADLQEAVQQGQHQEEQREQQREHPRLVVEPLPASEALVGGERLSAMAQKQINATKARALAAASFTPAADTQPAQVVRPVEEPPSQVAASTPAVASVPMGESYVSPSPMSKAQVIDLEHKPDESIELELPKTSLGTDHHAMKERMRQKFEQKLSSLGVALL